MTWKVASCDYSPAMQGYFVVLRDEHGKPLAGYHRKQLEIGAEFDGRFGRLEGADFGGNPDDFDSFRYRDGNKAVLLDKGT